MTTLRPDVIIVGAGVAGSRLLAQLLASPWQTRQILVIEREAVDRRDHLLAFWTDRPGTLDPLIEHRWPTLRVVEADGADGRHRTVEENYVATRRLRITDRGAAARPNVRWLAGAVAEIVDGEREAAVRVGECWYHAAWVFDSRRAPPGPATVRLVQRFTGWIVESPQLRLDPATATLFDFRTEQAAGVGFLYILPLSPTRALVEHVAMGPAPESFPPAEAQLSIYLRAHLGLLEGGYTIVAREHGSSALSDARHPRRLGRRICAIGVRGGRLKPSSGYALTRIEADSAAIVRSLVRYGHPFHLPRERRLVGMLDAIFLWALLCEPRRAPRIFAALLRRPDRTLRFLDERPRLLDLVHLLCALPGLVFVRAAWRWLWARATIHRLDGGGCRHL